MLMLHNLPPLTSSSESETRQPMRGENCPHWTNERPETPGECVSIPWSHKAATQINRVSNGRSSVPKNKILCFLCHPECQLSLLHYKLLLSDQEIGSPSLQLLKSLKKDLRLYSADQNPHNNRRSTGNLNIFRIIISHPALGQITRKFNLLQVKYDTSVSTIFSHFDTSQRLTPGDSQSSAFA